MHCRSLSDFEHRSMTGHDPVEVVQNELSVLSLLVHRFAARVDPDVLVVQILFSLEQIAGHRDPTQVRHVFHEYADTGERVTRSLSDRDERIDLEHSILILQIKPVLVVGIDAVSDDMTFDFAWAWTTSEQVVLCAILVVQQADHSSRFVGEQIQIAAVVGVTVSADNVGDVLWMIACDKRERRLERH